MSLSEVGVPGQRVDVLSGGDVDPSGRLLSVAEIQQAFRELRARTSAATTTPPAPAGRAVPAPTAPPMTTPGRVRTPRPRRTKASANPSRRPHRQGPDNAVDAGRPRYRTGRPGR